jgi:outer membrane autotransporter protein
VAKELLIGATINSGVITPSGAGAVIVDGPSASLTLGNGFGPSQDSLEVVNGLLVVENGATLSAQSGTIGALGQMIFTNGGTGFFSGNLVNNGVIKPGTLTVSGNYIQSATGTLRIEVAGLAPGQFDLLQVGGHASLAGTLQLIRIGNFQLHVGDKLTFLTAGSVSGSFSTIQNPFLNNTLVKVQIAVLPTAVLLQVTQGSFAAVAMTPNSLAVARALDSAAGDPRAAALINFLNNEPLSKLFPDDFNLISPDQLTSVFNIAVSLANVQSSNLERRMDDVRGGSTGFSSAGFTMNGATPSYSAGLGGPTGAEGKSGPSVMAPIPENRWGVFATGIGEFTHVDSTDIARGFDLQTGGVTFGVDYRIGSNFALGLIAGYAHTNADLANNGNLDINSGKFGLYGTAFSGGLYLDSAVTGGFSGYDTRRTALLGTASGSTNGGDLNVLVNGGYDWKKGSLSIGPTASFQYTYVSFDGFTESGSLAPLKFNDQHVDSIRTAFGMKASYDWKVGSVLVRPELRVGWQHEYGTSAYSIAASFANGAGSSFTVSSPKIGRDSLLLGAGFAVLWSDRISTYIYYDGELGRTNYQSNNVSAGVRVTF